MVCLLSKFWRPDVLILISFWQNLRELWMSLLGFSIFKTTLISSRGALQYSSIPPSVTHNISDTTDWLLQNLGKRCMSTLPLSIFRCREIGPKWVLFLPFDDIFITCHWSTFLKIAQGRTEHAWYIHPAINLHAASYINIQNWIYVGHWREK